MVGILYDRQHDRVYSILEYSTVECHLFFIAILYMDLLLVVWTGRFWLDCFLTVYVLKI